MKIKFYNRIGNTVLALLLMSWMILIAGCENNPTEIEDYVPEPKLTAYLYVDQPVEEVILEEVGSLYSYYTPESYYISGADIVIFPVGNPAAGDTLHLMDNTASGGNYIPAPGEELIPAGGQRYRIEVRKPSDDIYLWAETTVPGEYTLAVNDTFIITNDTPPDTFYGEFTWDDPAHRLTWDSADSAGGYIWVGQCLTPEDQLVPLDPDFNMEDLPDDPSRIAYQFLMDYINSGTAPWIAFFWEGRYKIMLQACDQAYFDYVFSLMRVQQGVMEEPLYNVHGGIGMFSGISEISYTMEMDRVN